MTAQDLRSWLDEHRHWCMSLLRIYLGVGLVAKAVTFVSERDDLVQMMEESNILWAGAWMAHFIIITHAMGGTLMALGLGTRIGALIQVPNLVGAVFFVQWSGGVMGFAEELRFSALVLFLLLLFIWHGSGPLSVTSRLGRTEAAPA